MFIKTVIKRIKSTGEYKTYYRLVESYRHKDSIRHQTIIQLGALDELGSVDRVRLLGARIHSLVKENRTGMRDMYTCEDNKVETLAHHFVEKIKEKDRIDLAKGKNYHAVDTDTIKNKNVREAGAEWICAQAIRQLGITEFFSSQGWDQREINLALTHIISRASYPASELRTSHWIKENSAVCEITGFPQALITKDKLYNISHKLYSVKDELEQHLSKRTNELFDINDSIILYDLTNTYYEGKKLNSKIAQYGRSKEKRSDCKLIVLAVVVNTYGFIKYSQLFEGNLADSKGLLPIIEALSKRTSATGRKPIVVMDAGIATEDNIQLLREYSYDYLCVSRSGMNKYSADSDVQPIQIVDKKGQPITIQKVKVKGDTDNYLLVHSKAKEIKEQSMNSRFTKRYEQDLAQIKDSLSKKSGVKKLEKVWERIGRIKQKYPSLNKRYNIEVISNGKGIAVDVKWNQKPQPPKEGKYLLRTCLNEQDEKTQWTIYNTIREIESTFRTLKTDLDLRPIYHKKDDASMAHLHLGLLAYTVVNTIRYQLKQKGIKNEWRDLVRMMNTQKMLTTTMLDQYEQQIIIRQCSEPTTDLQKIYDALEFKNRPFGQRKFVVPPEQPHNIQSPIAANGLSP